MPYEDDLPRVDRSTLEAYAACPLSARLSADALPTMAMVSGTEAHRAIGEAIESWTEEPTMRRGELADLIRRGLYYSRPDVQPDVVRGCERSAWAIAGLFDRLSPSHVMRYDGGRGAKSGQLSYELKTLQAVATCEVDLLLATASRQQVSLIDWKSGWKQWTAASVADSFQFQFYAVAVLHTYPELESVLVRILNTRTADWTYEIEFTRADMERLMARVNMAAHHWYLNRSRELSKVDAWPGVEKCDWCRCAARCTAANRESTGNPVELVATLQAMAAKSAAIEAILEKHVRETGSDIETADGLRFGFNKPKRATKPKAALYAVKTKPEETEE